MGFVERRNGKYRARYRDPLCNQRCRTFTRKADAERFVREMEVDVERGAWLDPRAADVPLAVWADEFLALARRLSPTTVRTYRRDLDSYILVRFGSYRIGTRFETAVQAGRREGLTWRQIGTAAGRPFQTLQRRATPSLR